MNFLCALLVLVLVFGLLLPEHGTIRAAFHAPPTSTSNQVRGGLKRFQLNEVHAQRDSSVLPGMTIERRVKQNGGNSNSYDYQYNIPYHLSKHVVSYGTFSSTFEIGISQGGLRDMIAKYEQDQQDDDDDGDGGDGVDGVKVWMLVEGANDTAKLGCDGFVGPGPDTGSFSGSDPAMSSVSGWAAIVERGGDCTFEEKALAAQASGASWAIIIGTVEGMYNETTGGLQSVCSLNCQAAKGESQEMCDAKAETSSSCGIDRCAENVVDVPEKKKDDDLDLPQYCCIDDKLIPMSFSSEALDELTIPAIFVGIEDGEKLKQVARESFNDEYQGVYIYRRPVEVVDASLIIIASFGTLVVLLGSYRGAATERIQATRVYNKVLEIRTRGLRRAPQRSQHLQQHHHHHQQQQQQQQLQVANPSDATGGGNHVQQHQQQQQQPQQEEETLDFGLAEIAGFFVCVTIMIVTLFFILTNFPHIAVLIINALFALGATGSMSIIIVQPVIRKLVGKERAYTRIVLPRIGDVGVNVEEAIGLVISAAFAWTWFAFRRSQWAWILHNILALALTCVFLMTIRLPNLKVGAILYGLFFVYDVFMVFITPAFLGGTSVMLEVATAGGASEEDDAVKCVRNAEERMPLLISVSRFDWIGGFSMLGLGDLFIPGLVVVLALRIDYAKMQENARRQYYAERTMMLQQQQNEANNRYHISHADGNRASDGDDASRDGHRDSSDFESREDTDSRSRLVSAAYPDANRSSLVRITMSCLLSVRQFFKVHQYWLPIMIAYAAGLALAYTANIRGWDFGTGIQGQPALLYLVPTTLSTFVILGWYRGELKTIWTDEWVAWENPQRARAKAIANANANANANAALGDAEIEAEQAQGQEERQVQEEEHSHVEQSAPDTTSMSSNGTPNIQDEEAQ